MGNLVTASNSKDVRIRDTVSVPFGDIITGSSAGACIDAAMSQSYYEKHGYNAFTGTVVNISKRYMFGLLKRRYPLYTVGLGLVDIYIKTYNVVK